LMLGGMLLCGVTLGLTGISSSIWLAVVFYALSAFGVATWNVSYGAMRQELIPGPLLGRTIGVIRTITWGMFPIASVIGGFIGRIDLRLPFIVGGIVSVVVVLLGARLLLSASDQKAPDEQAVVEDATPLEPHVDPAETAL